MEQELKIMLSYREYNLLLPEVALGATQTNYYFSSKSSEYSARIREKQGTYTLTAKQRLSNSNGIALNREYSSEISDFTAKALISDGITTKTMKDILELTIESPYMFVGELVTFRVKYVWRGYAFELDKNTYLGRTDYELECENTDYEQLEILKQLLIREFGLTIRESQGKMQRFFNAKEGL
ncbi:MAG: CYTH domain-containing protein [Clostridia bacterium]